MAIVPNGSIRQKINHISALTPTSSPFLRLHSFSALITCCSCSQQAINSHIHTLSHAIVMWNTTLSATGLFCSIISYIYTYYSNEVIQFLFIIPRDAFDCTMNSLCLVKWYIKHLLPLCLVFTCWIAILRSVC
jgi:hypothetical protein